MQKKNRFSTALEHLMFIAEIKNYTLAQHLQYDVSYISKWINGRMLPAEKGLDKIILGISDCIICSLNEKTEAVLYQEFQVNNKNYLRTAIFDRLMAEYNYVKDLKKNIGSDIAPSITLSPELTMLEFINKMKHPAARKVTSLQITLGVDIMAINKDYQLQIVDLQNNNQIVFADYPGVHFDMLIYIGNNCENPIQNSVFLLNLLTYTSFLNFTLYETKQICGRILFNIDDAYSMTGMILDDSHCIAVTTSEDPSICQPLHQKTQSFCSNDTLLVRKLPMRELMDSFSYVQSLISGNRCWLLGHMMEHFMPADLFQEILQQVSEREDWHMDSNELLKAYHLLTRIEQEAPLRVLLYESALSDFAVSGELDFFNTKVTLTTEQRIRYIKHLASLVEAQNNLEIHLLQAGLTFKFPHIPNPSMFLSDTSSYLRLTLQGEHNAPHLLCRNSIRTLFRTFFDQVWSDEHPNQVQIKDREELLEVLKHTAQSIELLAGIDYTSIDLF